MVGQGAYEYGVANSMVAVDPLNLVSGNWLQFLNLTNVIIIYKC